MRLIMSLYYLFHLNLTNEPRRLKSNLLIQSIFDFISIFLSSNPIFQGLL